jgi:hypothetical protein
MFAKFETSSIDWNNSNKMNALSEHFNLSKYEYKTNIIQWIKDLEEEKKK